MENREVGKLTLNFDPEALRSVIGSGRLLELADTLSKEAAAQISAQLVEQGCRRRTKTGRTENWRFRRRHLHLHLRWRRLWNPPAPAALGSGSNRWRTARTAPTNRPNGHGKLSTD